MIQLIQDFPVMILTIFLVILNVRRKNKRHRKVFNLNFKKILKFLLKLIFKKFPSLPGQMRKQKDIQSNLIKNRKFSNLEKLDICNLIKWTAYFYKFYNSKCQIKQKTLFLINSNQQKIISRYGRKLFKLSCQHLLNLQDVFRILLFFKIKDLILTKIKKCIGKLLLLFRLKIINFSS